MRHATLSCLAISLVLLASACVSAPARRPADLAVPVPYEWSAAAAGAGDLSDTWWKEFGDPDLDLLLEEALAANHDLAAAATRIEAAAAQAKIAGADLVPSAGFGLDGSRSRSNLIGVPIPNAPPVIPIRTTNVGVSLDASWEADVWGRIRAGKRAAIADLQAAEAEYHAARLSLTGQTARTWFALIETRQQLDLAERTLRSFRSTAEQVRSRFERGLRSSLDLRLALTNLHGAEAAVERRRIQRDALVRQMEILLGRYPAGALSERTTIPGLPGPVPAGVPADLIARRPDVVAVERRLAASGERGTEARRSLYPRITLTASGGRRSNELDDLLAGNFSVWTLAAAIFQPVFQGGRLRAGVDLADARSREAAESYVSAAFRAYAEVETALEAEYLLARLEESLAAASEQAAAARRLAEDRYSSGLDDFLTVLEAQRRDIEAEGRLLSLRRERLDTRIDLYLALGGGFEAAYPAPGEGEEVNPS